MARDNLFPVGLCEFSETYSRFRSRIYLKADKNHLYAINMVSTSMLRISDMQQNLMVGYEQTKTQIKWPLSFKMGLFQVIFQAS